MTELDNRMPTGVRWLTPMVWARIGALTASTVLFGQLAWRILS